MKKINIKINLNSKEDFYSVYNENTLSPMLSDYLVNELSLEDLDAKVVINIDNDFKLSDEEKENYRNIIKKDFKSRNVDLLYVTKMDYYKRVLFLTFGVLIIILSTFLKDMYMIHELMTIVSWVLIWETVSSKLDYYFKKSIRIKRYKQLINSEINFVGK